MMDLFDHDRLLELSLLYRRRGFLKLLPKGLLHWIFVSNALNSKMGGYICSKNGACCFYLSHQEIEQHNSLAIHLTRLSEQ